MFHDADTSHDKLNYYDFLFRCVAAVRRTPSWRRHAHGDGKNINIFLIIMRRMHRKRKQV